jgi:hypothetical protein
MPSHFSSLWSSPRRASRLVEGTIELFARAASVSLPLLACLSAAACGGEEDDGVTYGDEVQGLFYRRCTTCHHPGSPINVDIENPFNPETGLVYTSNSWAAPNAYPGETDERNVVPGDPDSSFLMDKISGALPTNGHGGGSMPMQVSALTPEEVGALEQWITNGALNDAFYTNNVRPIFGAEDDAGLFFSGKCVFCHYPNSPNPGLDLTEPFGPNGLVNVDATYRGDIKRVQPGNPEESLLMLKVRAERPESDIGAQMPYSFDLLTAGQIDTVRQWIVEGARP